VVAGLSGLFARLDSDLYLNSVPFIRKVRHCRFIDEGMAFVRSDGRREPCMALLHNGTTYYEGVDRKIHHHSFGNVKKQSLKEIWDSDEYRAFRRRVETFDFSPCVSCGHCHAFESNQDDCFGNCQPTCGGCLWSEGILSCP
jgi:MoaA/NifB/PqqE/SkfB family radical SAM enzyme